jgi:hypothetical protein
MLGVTVGVYPLVDERMIMSNREASRRINFLYPVLSPCLEISIISISRIQKDEFVVSERTFPEELVKNTSIDMLPAFLQFHNVAHPSVGRPTQLYLGPRPGDLTQSQHHEYRLYFQLHSIYRVL